MSKKYTTNFLEDTNGSTGSTNQVLVSTAAGIDWVDGSGTGVIGGPYLPLAGGTMTGVTQFNDHTNYGDQVHARFGTGQDLQIYHDGSNSYIQDTSGTGDLRIDTSTFRLRSANGGETMIRAFEDGAVILSHNNFDKLTTTSAGVTVTGGWVTSGVSVAQANVEHTDNTKALFGNGNDLQIYHDGSNSYIKDAGTGNLWIQGSAQVNIGGANGEIGIQYVENAGVGLRHNNVTKLTTTNTGVTVTGNIDLPSNGAILFDNTNNIEQYYIRNGGGSQSSLQIGKGNPGSDIKFSLNDSGNVGIGTTSPAAKLDVFSASSFRADVATGNPLISIVNNTAISNTAGTATIKFTQGNTQAGGKIVSGRDGNYSSGATRASNLQFYTSTAASDTEKMRITSVGNVGIGTTTPSAKLEVAGDIHPASNVSYSLGSSTKSFLFTNTYAVSSAGDLQMFAGGSERMRIESSGNVGIGTTSPAHKLTVNAANDTTAVGIDFPSARFDFAANSTSGYATLFSMDDTGLDIGHDAASRSLNLKTNNLDRLTILGGGNVGIGTTSPTGKLDVVGSLVTTRVLTTGSLSLIGTDATASAQTVLTISTGVGNATGPNIVLSKSRSQSSGAVVANDPLGTIQFQGGNGTASVEGARIAAIAGSTWSSTNRDSDLLFWTTPSGSTTIAERMRIDSAGNVGIGTTTPTEKLVVQDGKVLAGHTNTRGYGFHDLSNYSYTANTGRLSLVTAGVEAVSIDNNQNVGINTTSPSEKLSVTGSANITSKLAVGSTASHPSFDFYNQGTAYFNGSTTVDDNLIVTDNVGIGTTSPSYKLDVTGTGRFTSTVTATNFILSSDERLKDNIKNIDDNHIDVDWKNFELKSEPGIKRSGVIAQELEEKHPEFVRTDKEGLKSVAYIDLLIAKIAELEARLEKAGI